MKAKKRNLSTLEGRLTRAEMKKLKGGNPGGGGGGSFCVNAPIECFEQNGIKYTCYVHWEGEEEQCCCGHYSGNSNCIAA